MATPRQTLRMAGELVGAGLIGANAEANVARVAQRYALAITSTVADLIDRSDANDPLARQFIPDARELDTHPAELPDPISDAAKSPVKGIVHRYPDRVLLKIIGVCPVYCRFCFRREMVGPDAGVTLDPDEIDAALDYIRERPAITEVILTGGDPFMLSPRRAMEVTRAIADIPHVSVLRWHTRVPVAAPERVTAELGAAMTGTRLHVIVALHINHCRELSAEARSAIAALHDAGVTLLSQSVLLRGVNDEPATLEALMRALAASGVRPYYLHHGDLAPGTSHFRTSLAHGQALMRELRLRLPVMSLPRYVLDIPGGFGKVTAEAPWVTAGPAAGHYIVTDPAGQQHHYADALACP